MTFEEKIDLLAKDFFKLERTCEKNEDIEIKEALRIGLEGGLFDFENAVEKLDGYFGEIEETLDFEKQYVDIVCYIKNIILFEASKEIDLLQTGDYVDIAFNSTEIYGENCHNDIAIATYDLTTNLENFLIENHKNFTQKVSECFLDLFATSFHYKNFEDFLEESNNRLTR